MNKYKKMYGGLNSTSSYKIFTDKYGPIVYIISYMNCVSKIAEVNKNCYHLVAKTDNFMKFKFNPENFEFNKRHKRLDIIYCINKRICIPIKFRLPHIVSIIESNGSPEKFKSMFFENDLLIAEEFGILFDSFKKETNIECLKYILKKFSAMHTTNDGLLIIFNNYIEKCINLENLEILDCIISHFQSINNIGLLRFFWKESYKITKNNYKLFLKISDAYYCDDSDLYDYIKIKCSKFVNMEKLNQISSARNSNEKTSLIILFKKIY